MKSIDVQEAKALVKAALKSGIIKQPAKNELPVEALREIDKQTERLNSASGRTDCRIDVVRVKNPNRWGRCVGFRATIGKVQGATWHEINRAADHALHLLTTRKMSV